VAMHLLNTQRPYLVRLEAEFSTKIGVAVDPLLKNGQIRIEAAGQAQA